VIIRVQNRNPARAARDANAYAGAFTDAISDVGENDRERLLARIDERVKEIQRELNRARGDSGTRAGLTAELQSLQGQAAGARTRPIDVGRVIEPARPPSDPASPKPLRDAGIAFIAALLLSAFVAYLAFVVSNRYQSSTEVAEDLNLPVLGELPKGPPEDQRVVDAFRAVRTNVDFAVQGSHGATSEPSPAPAPPPPAPASPAWTEGGVLSQTAAAFRSARRRQGQRDLPREATSATPSATEGPVVLVTSPEEGTGKTYVATNLARALATDGHQVIAVDGDLRRPQLHERYDLPLEPGITDGLNPNGSQPSVPSKQVRLPRHAVGRGGQLMAITAGRPAEDSTEIVATDQMAELVDRLVHQHEYVVVDSPPVLATADAAVLSRYANGVILVVDAHRTRRRTARRAVQALRSVGAPILGIVFNRVSRAEAGYYGYDIRREDKQSSDEVEAPSEPVRPA
jgi:capsular exopolysaccharide synthesis family protein